MLNRFFPYYRKIFRSPSLPCFVFGFESQITPIKVLTLNIDKRDSDARHQFLLKTGQLKDTHVFVFTDASKRENVGMGISIPKIKFNFASKLPKELSICNAELAAIHEAIIVTVKKHIDKAIIFTDSQSAIKRLQRALLTTDDDFLTCQTRNLIQEINKLHNCEILLGWIPSHVGILGNEEADRLANVGRILNVPKEVFVPIGDIVNIIKNELALQFRETWRELNDSSRYSSSGRLLVMSVVF